MAKFLHTTGPAFKDLYAAFTRAAELNNLLIDPAMRGALQGRFGKRQSLAAVFGSGFVVALLPYERSKSA